MATKPNVTITMEHWQAEALADFLRSSEAEGEFQSLPHDHEQFMNDLTAWLRNAVAHNA